MVARDLMATRVETVGPRLPLRELEELFHTSRVSGAPVVDDGRLVGVVSHTDIVRVLCQEQAGASATLSFYTSPWDEEVLPLELIERESSLLAQRMARLRVADAMTREILAVGPGTSVDAVARTMVEERVHRVLVTERDRLLGLVSSLDLVRLVGEQGLAAA